jgi:hypothetical protein
MKLSPNEATSYTYKIGTIMAPLLYQVNLNQGTSSVTVNGQTDNIQETYGIIVSQITKDFETLIFLTSQYNNEDLVNQTLSIILTFTLDSMNVFTFPPITATYLDFKPLLSEGARFPDS